MSVKLNTRQVGDVSVVDVAGRITLGEGSSALRDTLRDLVGKNNKKILLTSARFPISTARASASWYRASPPSPTRADN